MSRTHHRGGGANQGWRVTDGSESAVDALRPVRATVFAAVCVAATALGHALMSDDGLPWWAVGVAFAGTASGAWWLTAREHGAAAVVGATVTAQGLLHLLFSLSPRLMPTTKATVDAPGAMGVSHAHHGAATSHPDMVMHPSGRLSGAMGTPSGESLWSAVTHGDSGGMLLAHLLAAVACGVWLWRGEAAAHRIARALAAAVFAPLRRVCHVLFHATILREVPLRGVTVDGGENRRPAPAALRHAVVRRGPPPGRVTFSRPSPAPRLTTGT